MLMTQQEFQSIVKQINDAFAEQFNRIEEFDKRLKALEEAKAPLKRATRSKASED